MVFVFASLATFSQKSMQIDSKPVLKKTPTVNKEEKIDKVKVNPVKHEIQRSSFVKPSFGSEENDYALQEIKNNLTRVRQLDYQIQKTSDVKAVSGFDTERVKLIDKILLTKENDYKALDMESKKTILGLAKERSDDELQKFHTWFKESFTK